jgi:hypothetical protein
MWGSDGVRRVALCAGRLGSGNLVWLGCVSGLLSSVGSGVGVGVAVEIAR